MTPLHINLMLHYYVTEEPYSKHDQFHANSIDVVSYREWLIENGMLVIAHPVQPAPNYAYTVTEKGKAYINFLCSVPLPVERYVVEME